MCMKPNKAKKKNQLANDNRKPLNASQRRFRWDELGMYDVPAFIDYILAVTKWPKLTYIGHSLGTAEFFIGMIQHPRLNAKIYKMIALAPISSKARLESPVRFIFPFLTPPVTVILLHFIFFFFAKYWNYGANLVNPVVTTTRNSSLNEIVKRQFESLFIFHWLAWMEWTAGFGEVPEACHIRQQRFPTQGAT